MDEPKFLLPLVVFLNNRNKALGIPKSFGLLQDVLRLYVGYLEDREYYESLIEVHKDIAFRKLAQLKRIIKQSENEDDPIKLKQLLITALELKQELDLIDYGSE